MLQNSFSPCPSLVLSIPPSFELIDALSCLSCQGTHKLFLFLSLLTHVVSLCLPRHPPRKVTMRYKRDLGGRVYPRREFLSRWHAATACQPPVLTSLSRTGGSSNSPDRNSGWGIDSNCKHYAMTDSPGLEMDLDMIFQ